MEQVSHAPMVSVAQVRFAFAVETCISNERKTSERVFMTAVLVYGFMDAS